MNDHNPHNNGQRPDETQFGYILKSALLHREDESIGTAQHRSANPRVPDHNQHGSIWLGQECADCQEMRS